MKFLRLQRCLTAFFICISLSCFICGGCTNKATLPHSSSSIENSSFSTDLPSSFSSSNGNAPLEEPIVQESANDSEYSVAQDSSQSEDSAEETIDPTVWNVSDVDISAVDCNKKLIAFTFDDAPTRATESLFAVFAAFNEQNPDTPATATLFLNGYLFDKETPHLLHAAKTLGFELGNHMQSHFDLTTLTKDELKTEIDATDALLKFADGKERHLLRPPYGKFNENVKNVAQTPIIHWSIDTLDWAGTSADDIYETVFSNRSPGAIVLMHDGYPATIDALKRLLPDLKADGYQVVSVSQMAKAHGCILRNGSVYIRARK